MGRLLLVLVLVTSVASADTIPGNALVDFEAASDGTVMTSALMLSATRGQTWNGWQTLSNPGGQTQGSTPSLKFSSAASQHLYTPADINGTVYVGSGSLGLRATMDRDNAVQLKIPSPGYQLSVGFYFRFNGSQINSSPRDVFGLRSDPTGNYQFLQIYDGSQPYFHTHWQPGAGIGNNVNFNRNQWYWVTMRHVAGGNSMRISFYDPSKNYALVGTSSGAVTSGTQGCTTIQVGCIKYASGGSQSVDFDNIIINTAGVFPLGPGNGSGGPVNQAPVATANANPRSGVVPLTVAFSSAGSADPEGNVLTYNWVFGDGTSSTAANPSHTYQTAGNYTASLAVSDGANSTTSSAITITVSAPAVNQPPTAVASASPTNGVAPLAVNFSSAGSSDPEGRSLTYSWNFGDGGSSTAANPSRSYQNAGTYTARVAVSDGTNSTTSSAITITVTAPGVNQPPTATASASATNGAAPLSVSFSSAGSSDPEGRALTYNWTFGDSTTSTAANPSHTYSSPGNYSARLTVSDGTNNASSASIPITVVAAGSGLVANYRFDEGTGSVVNDSSGNNNTGAVGGATWTAGKSGQALSFDGNSIVTVPDSPSLRSASALTIAAWVYPTSATTDWSPIIFKPLDAAQISFVLQGASPPSGAPSFNVLPSSGNVFGTALPINTWSHLAATYDGTRMRLYVNGAEVGSKAQTGALDYSNEALTIGGNALYQAYWRGSIDEVHIYNRALAVAEIQADMDTPAVPKPSPPQNLRIVTP